MDEAVEKSIHRHRLRVRRHQAGEHKASVKRAQWRTQLTKVGLHPHWGRIGPSLPGYGMSHLWYRAYKRAQVKRGGKWEGDFCNAVFDALRAGTLGPPANPFRSDLPSKI